MPLNKETVILPYPPAPLVFSGEDSFGIKYPMKVDLPLKQQQQKKKKKPNQKPTKYIRVFVMR